MDRCKEHGFQGLRAEASCITTAPTTLCTHVLDLLMYVLHVPTVDARMLKGKKLPADVSTYLLLYVRTYCTYLVLVYLLMYAYCGFY